MRHSRRRDTRLTPETAESPPPARRVGWESKPEEESLADLRRLLDELEEEAVATLSTRFEIPPRAERWREGWGWAADLATSLSVAAGALGAEGHAPPAIEEALGPVRRRAKSSEAQALSLAWLRLRDVGILREMLDAGLLAGVAAGLAGLLLDHFPTSCYRALLEGEALKAKRSRSPGRPEGSALDRDLYFEGWCEKRRDLTPLRVMFGLVKREDPSLSDMSALALARTELAAYRKRASARRRRASRKAPAT